LKITILQSGQESFQVKSINSEMKSIDSITELRKQLNHWRQAGLRIALVPTMGNLHAGHLSLIEKARKLAEKVVVSIFVNPTQFVEGEDYESYPRTPEEDRKKLEALDVDILFQPRVHEIYPVDLSHQTKVIVPHLDNIFCGESRPGHFAGVATVVTKLLNIVQPDFAIFGEKDYQQLQVIRQLVRDLCMTVEVVSMPTLREASGLAMSSRNAYLTDQDREKAATLYRVLNEMAEVIRGGGDNYQELEKAGLKILTDEGFKPDYLAVVDAETLGPPGEGDLAILVAAWIGRARLIDNVIIRR